VTMLFLWEQKKTTDLPVLVVERSSKGLQYYNACTYTEVDQVGHAISKV
jgi:hypothetical protein